MGSLDDGREVLEEGWLLYLEKGKGVEDVARAEEEGRRKMLLSS